ncbi:glutaredoxin family protein [Thermoactinomyces sp. DSM 45892]|uniref:glutaredoxin family protein n=1 Tax=Thermoactinomyces sp. DSM 45892 TaxID=1882753 RepID=UPI00089C3642|nr:glutaredoxin family protein [Thermoactinomyces sp. DSM 45892]SDZ28307.1 ribonucleoside-diphosphate reductase class Ib glutaredoxin subunit [Thermoactinomyces sp. DSM 45892]
MSIIVYSKPHCPECNVLKRFLRDYQIDFVVRDLSKNPKYIDEVKRLGFLGVPVTVINGKAIPGLQPDAILSMLGRRY